MSLIGKQNDIKFRDKWTINNNFLDLNMLSKEIPTAITLLRWNYIFHYFNKCINMFIFYVCFRLQRLIHIKTFYLVMWYFCYSTVVFMIVLNTANQSIIPCVCLFHKYLASIEYQLTSDGSSLWYFMRICQNLPF